MCTGGGGGGGAGASDYLLVILFNIYGFVYGEWG